MNLSYERATQQLHTWTATPSLLAHARAIEVVMRQAALRYGDGVVGQILPRVPVWRRGPESRSPEMPLVVFPGNVVAADALTVLLDRLQDLAADNEN